MSTTPDNRFLVGTGVYDITGPAAELGMMGFSKPEQRTSGIHTRLYSRAFIVGDDSKRVVFVCADLLFMTPPVSLGVIEKLEDAFGSLYTYDNVMLTATHTHSGPGGYCGYALYHFSILGFDQQNYDAIVHGIFQSIVRAHGNLGPGSIRISQGGVDGASMNRSIAAYNANPDAEGYAHDVDRTMLLLRFEKEGGQEIGMLSWFAVHATNVGKSNRLISSDHKGFASYRFEKSKGTDYAADETFVAAFAQSNAGDVSPNLWGHPDGVHDYERMEVIGNRLLRGATALYDDSVACLSGSVDYRLAFLDFSRDGALHRDSRACVAAIGLSVTGGSKADGIGLPFIREGIAYGRNWLRFTLLPKDQACHKEKVIVLPTGRRIPHPWTPDILPIQIIRIGNLALLGLPAELTTMAGRRIRNALQRILTDIGVDTVVVAGYANSYCGYVTTAEEYALQNYEGAHTLFGPNTELVFREEMVKLALSMRDGVDVSSAAFPPDIRDSTVSFIPGVVFDSKPPFRRFGGVRRNAAQSYRRGDTVRVVFWGGHPKNNLRTQGTFLEVKKRTGDRWQAIAADNDPSTRYIWQRKFFVFSLITIELDIPQAAEDGEYRIVHHGHSKSPWLGKISEYRGESRTFAVT